jgi:hypothetical protein
MTSSGIRGIGCPGYIPASQCVSRTGLPFKDADSTAIRVSASLLPTFPEFHWSLHFAEFLNSSPESHNRVQRQRRGCSRTHSDINRYRLLEYGLLFAWSRFYLFFAIRMCVSRFHISMAPSSGSPARTCSRMNLPAARCFGSEDLTNEAHTGRDGCPARGPV